MIAGLLEGAAFLAARVQLKLKHEFPEFTGNLLEQLVPNYLAPTPVGAACEDRAALFGDPALREGSRIARGSYIDATYRERERRVACRYRLTSDVTLWPFDIAAPSTSRPRARCRRSALPSGRTSSPGCGSRSATASPPQLEDEMPDGAGGEAAGILVRRLPDASELPIHLLGSESGCDRALRAALRRLHRRLLPLSR